MRNISDYTKEELQKFVNESSTISEILEKIGKRKNTGARKTLNKYLKFRGVDLKEFSKRQKDKQINGIRNYIHSISKPLNEILVENSNYDGYYLKKRLLECNLIEEKCAICGQPPIHNGIPLVLQLDHKDGIHSNNKIENLRLLCPNCHTQTPTWGSKDRNPKKYYCIDCTKETKGYGKKCNSCASIEFNKDYRKFEVSREDLERLLYEMPMIKIGEKFGVTDNSIRQRCETLNIQIPDFKPGYWLRTKINITKEELDSLIKKKMTYSQIGKTYNVSGSCIKSLAKHFKIYVNMIHPNNSKLSNVTKEELYNLRIIEGKTLREIADIFGVNSTTSIVKLEKKLKLYEE